MLAEIFGEIARGTQDLPSSTVRSGGEKHQAIERRRLFSLDQPLLPQVDRVFALALECAPSRTCLIQRLIRVSILACNASDNDTPENYIGRQHKHYCCDRAP